MARDLSRAIDAVVLVLVAAIAVGGAALRAEPTHRPQAVALAAAAAAVLILRRRAPAITLAVSGALVLALVAVDNAAATTAVAAPAAALYSLALIRGRRQILLGALAAAVAVIVADVFFAGGTAHTLTLQTLGHAALVAIPVLAAEALRNHRSNVLLLRDRLELAERTREQEARRRAEQERLRIARELHDVVAHTLTTINVQAGVAKHLLKDRPDHAEDALATIEAASHEALQELRAILGVLRQVDDEAPLEPAPGLDAVEALIDQARSAGGEIDLQITGIRPERVPDGVQLAAFRIVQESLTNSRRHAPGAPAAVTITYAPDRLQLTVENATTERENGTGHDGTGLTGMRERAAALGGTLTAQGDGDRFRVAAELPYTPAP